MLRRPCNTFTSMAAGHELVLYCVRLPEAKVSVASSFALRLDPRTISLLETIIGGFFSQSDKIGWSTSYNLFAKSSFNHQSVKASAADLRLPNGRILSLFSHASTLTYLKSVIFHLLDFFRSLFLCGPFYCF